MKTTPIESILSPKQKALSVNLDPKIYGSFAEIGAGQEVAQHFFNAGAASGSIAKTMSAYDMKFSDAIYGAEESGRYVCEPRLNRMLEKEYELLEIRLREERPDTSFFAFANTVEILNYHKTNAGHGWIGLRFQTDPKQKVPNEVIMHVNLLDNHRHLQQEISGLLGVNLIFGCFNYYQDLDRLLLSMMENISRDRVEIDMFRVSGPAFEEVDNRILSLKLVKNGMSNASMFGPDGYVQQPSQVLYKKNILALRGRFRPVTHVNMDMLQRGYKMFVEEEDVQVENVLMLAELTLNNLTLKEGEIDEQDFLDRVDILCSLGCTVMISNYHEYYRLIEYLSQFTRGRMIGVILGVFNLADVFNETFYTGLNGGILEALGRLFGQNVKLFVYPSRIPGMDQIITKNSLELEEENMMHLFDYLKSKGKFTDITRYNAEILHIYSDYVLTMIKAGKSGWEDMVPIEVEEAVKDRCLFGYPCPVNKLEKVAQERIEKGKIFVSSTE